MQSPAPTELLSRVRAQSWGAALLDALASVENVHLVGGTVRDLLLGHEPIDIDLAVVGDAGAAASALAERLGGRATEHERFGTATVDAPGFPQINVVTARRERYAHPGALPDVEPGSLEDDLARRDFTVNALALALPDGSLRAAPHGLEDLHAGLIRAMHDASFVDDPTRLLRAVRYETRLGFALEPRTEELAREGDFATVSGARIRDELLDLLREPGAPRSVERLGELGLAAALHPQLRADGPVVAGALAIASEDARRDLVALAACCLEIEPEPLRAWLDELALEASEREAVLRAATQALWLAADLGDAESPSQIAALAEHQPVEALALAGALGAEEPARRWLEDLRHVRLEISGDDLLAAGVREGPELGRALRTTLDRKLDGDIDGRDAELAAALDALGDG